MALLSQADILRGLAKLDAAAKAEGVFVDLSVYGGAAMALAFDARASTRDVDAVARGGHAFLRRAVARIAEEEQWPADWLNDAVKRFTSGHERMQALELFEPSPQGGLRVYAPAPEYLFAMKCMAMRIAGTDAHDLADIRFLAKETGIRDAKAALALIENFYPRGRIPAKVQFGIEEIMERLQSARTHDDGVEP